MGCRCSELLTVCGQSMWIRATSGYLHVHLEKVKASGSLVVAFSGTEALTTVLTERVAGCARDKGSVAPAASASGSGPPAEWSPSCCLLEPPAREAAPAAECAGWQGPRVSVGGCLRGPRARAGGRPAGRSSRCVCLRHPDPVGLLSVLTSDWFWSILASE